MIVSPIEVLMLEEEAEMTNWGVFERKRDLQIHVAPCTDDGRILPPHILSLGCPCRPAVDDLAPMIVHEEIQ